MTKDKLFRDKELGLHAQMLTENSLLKVILDSIERDAIEAIKNADVRTQDNLVLLLAAKSDLSAAVKFRSKLEAFIANGRVAVRELESK